MSKLAVQQLDFDGTLFYPENTPPQEVQADLAEQTLQAGLLQKLGELPTKAAI